MNKHQYLSIRRLFEQFNAINDPSNLKSIIDTHHFAHFENPSYKQGVIGKKIIPKRKTESNALRISPDRSGEVPRVVGVIRPPKNFKDNLLDQFEDFRFQEYFGSTED